MTWLHRHDQFSPDWEEIDTDSLGDRRIVFHQASFRFRLHETIVVVGEERTLCREKEVRKEPLRREGTVLFEPGTATPLAYSGLAGCLAEAPFENPPDIRTRLHPMNCAIPPEYEVILDGYTWNFERSSAGEQKKLSRNRLEGVESRLEHTALPSEVRQSEAHDASSMTAPLAGTRPVPGVAITVAKSGNSGYGHGIQYRQSTGRAWSETEMEAFQEFMTPCRNSPDRSFPSTAEAFTSLKYRTESGRVVDTSIRSGDRPALSVVIESAEALVDNGCEVSKVGMPDEFR
jgi:hypothetical protein